MLSAQEQSQMLLAHTLGSVSDLAKTVEEMKPVEEIMLHAFSPHYEHIEVYVESDYESQLKEVIYDLQLKTGIDHPISPAELRTRIRVALEHYIEVVMANIYDYLAEEYAPWTREVIDPLLGWEPSYDTEEA